jgi:hypothetical protein
MLKSGTVRGVWASYRASLSLLIILKNSRTADWQKQQVVALAQQPGRAAFTAGIRRSDLNFEGLPRSRQLPRLRRGFRVLEVREQPNLARAWHYFARKLHLLCG